MPSDNTFHTLYRPKNFSELIGHETQVTRLKGMVKANKIPGALLFVGPSASGKTTLARALATEINGSLNQDYKEVNAANTRSIEEMRDLIKMSKFRPASKKRIFVIDEAQQLLSNAVAAQAILKPLEDAGNTDTLWILCSMEPSKFGSGTGKAIANRCTQFVLEPHSNAELFKQGLRIIKAEKMSYVDKDILKEIVKSSNNEMRTLSSLIQGVRDYANGMDESAKIDASIVSRVLKSSESSDDQLVVEAIVGLLTGQYSKVHRALLSVSDSFTFVNKLLYAARYQLDVMVLNGERHPKVWPNQINKDITSKLKGTKLSLGLLGELTETMTRLKSQSMAFAVDETSLMTSCAYRFIKDNFPK